MTVLFLLGAAWVVLPFQTHSTVLSPGLDRNRPAGQITRGFSLSETVPSSFMAALDGTADVDCIALRFATYMRRNEGQIEVIFGQAGSGHRWLVDVSRLQDNAYVNLCLGRPIRTDEPFWVTINGVDGMADRSATVWLSATRGRQVVINGKVMPGWGLALRLTQSRQVHVSDLLAAGNGAFAAGLLVSIIVGLTLLLNTAGGAGSRTGVAARQHDWRAPSGTTF